MHGTPALRGFRRRHFGTTKSVRTWLVVFTAGFVFTLGVAVADDPPPRPISTPAETRPAIPRLATRPVVRPAVAPVVYDSLLHLRKPASDQLRLHRLHVIYEVAFWPPNADKSSPHAPSVRRMADDVAAKNLVRNGVPVCLDIEHWPVDIRRAKREDVERSLAKLAEIADAIRLRNPGVKLGYYGIFPICDYWTTIQLRDARLSGDAAAIAQKEQAYRDWQAANDFIAARFLQHVDIVFPSLYQFYDDPDGWEIYARTNLDEAARGKRPVVPFLWFRYHESEASLKNAILPVASWRRQMEVVGSLTNEMIIWGGFGEPWDPFAPWWRETIRYLDQFETK